MGWYHEIIHDAFHSRWDQPMSIFDENRRFVCYLQIQIARDGTITDARITKSSGNPVMDESVLTAAKRVTKIPPLPEGVGDKNGYTITIAFELDQDR